MVVASTGCASTAPGWAVAQTANVRLRSDLGEEITRAQADRFQAVHDVLQASIVECKPDPPLPRIQVTLLSAESYDALRGSSTSGFFARNSFGYVADMNDHIVVRAGDSTPADQTFQHELSHRFVAACFPAAPTWLNEGLAGYFETLELRDDVLEVGLPPFTLSDFAYRPMQSRDKGRRVLMVSATRLPSLHDLIRLTPENYYRFTDRNEDLDQTAYHYAASWALVHFLELGEPKLSTRFHSYLRTLWDPSTDPVASFEATFDQRDLETRFDAYLHSPAPHPSIDTASVDRLGSAEGQPASVRRMSDAEAELHSAWLLTSVGGSRSLTDAHLQAALRDPAQRVGAMALQALLAAGAGDMLRARTLMSQVREAAPNDVELLALALEIELEMKPQVTGPGGASAQDVDAGALTVWRGQVRALNVKLRPSARTPNALRVLSRSDLALGDPALALDHINQSIALYPSHWASRVQRARACMANGLGECTLAELRVALNLVPHDATRAREGILEFERQVRSELNLPAASP